MRFLCFSLIAIVVGFTVYLISADILVAQKPTADELLRMEIQYNLGLLQDTADQAANGVWPPEGQTPFVPPKPSWPVAHSRIVGMLAGSIAALIAWTLTLVIASFMTKPTSPPAPVLERLEDAGIRLLPPLRR